MFGDSKLKFEEMKEQIHKNQKKILIISILIIAILITIFLISFSTSKYPISIEESFDVIINHFKGISYNRSTDYTMWYKNYVVWEYNVPRTIAAVIIGAALAICGAVMQATIRNPLADPYIVGISSGALFGVTIFIVYGVSVIPIISGNTAMCTNAFLFSLIPVSFIIVVSLFKKNITSTMMILIGIGVMYLFSSLSALIRFNADANAAAEVYEWTLGSIGSIGWDQIPLILISLIILIVPLPFIVNKLNALSLGDNISKSVGINVKIFRILCLILISIVTAIIVSFAGTIGFVGLVCPHIARMITGANNRTLIPFSALVGAIMLLSADCLARVVGTTGFPVGVITALIGCPIFIYMLIKQKKETW
jgi:iron complex transport system permease protein